MTHGTLQTAARTAYACLAQSPIADLLKHMRRARGLKPLIAVHEDTPLASVLTTLRTANILAVPVFRTPPHEPTGRLFTGIVSVFDILANTVFQAMFDNMADSACVLSMDAPEFEKYMAVLEQEQAFFATKVGSLVGSTRESSESWTLHSSDPLSSLLQMLTSARYHRVLVIDDQALEASARDAEDGFGPTAPPSGSSIRLVTQTDLVRYLADPAVRTALRPDAQDQASFDAALARIWSMPVSAAEELATQRTPTNDMEASRPLDAATGAPRKRVVTVRDTATALAAMRTMHQHGVPAVAIVDATERLVATLSASDLRGITAASIETLINPVFEFLEAGRRSVGQLAADQMRTVSPTTTVEDAALQMLGAHIHRVWMVDDEDTPVGVLSFSDVLSLFVPESDPEPGVDAFASAAVDA
ncbi:hypothetical protein HK105_206442 [Polyrhizophydium stewartii]|uniref:CBS domain-containing protein n=1 Tax=Polyrhizophydium stewartii TaxID=2732419 RepID=A0ABR4N3D5_9FUNG